METKKYLGYIIDRSQADKNIFNNLTVTNKKSFLFGLITIYEIQVLENDIDVVIKNIQKNMVKCIGLIKIIYKEFYAHFYSGHELIVVFREKTFHITSDKSTWTEAQAYGKSIGIIKKQLDFLTPEENKKRYFS
jgi:hypothetical protein